MTDADDIMFMNNEVIDSTNYSFQAIFSDQDSPRHAYRKNENT